KRPSIFFRSLSAIEASPQCPNCGGRRLTRLISRTAQVLSEDSRLEQLSDSAGLGDVDENDPKSMARWAKTMGQQLGGDEMGEDFDQVADEMGDAGPDEPDGADDDDLWAAHRSRASRAGGSSTHAEIPPLRLTCFSSLESWAGGPSHRGRHALVSEGRA